MKELLEMVALWPALCRGILQGCAGAALHATLLLGLGLLAGSALRRRGPALRSLLYQVTLAGTLVGTLASLVLAPHLALLWSAVSPPARAARTARSTGPAGWLAERLGGGPSARPDGAAAAGDHFGVEIAPPLLAGADRTDLALRPPAGAEDRAGAAAEGRRGSPRKTTSPSVGRVVGWLSVALVGIWGTGTLFLLARLLLCRLHVGRLLRRAVPVRETGAAVLADLCRVLGVHQPALLGSRSVRGPFLTGLRRPAIVLPADYAERFDGAMLRSILAHELVHLKRRDCAWNLLARLACAVGWIQPLLWVLCRRLEQASEEVCDLEVVRMEGDPRAYAECLLALFREFLLAPPEPALGRGCAGALGVVSFRSSLGRRIQQIMEGGRQGPLPLSARLRAAVALGASSAVVLGLLLASAVAAPPAGPGPRPAGHPDAPSEPAGRDTGRPGKSVLDGVAGLDRRVTYTETRIPLGELIQKVAAETGVALAAAPEVADEPVAVVVRELPARELLEQLAELLDYLWSRRGKEGAWRYEIWQDLAARNREEALRQAALADVQRRLTEQVRRFAEVAALPAQQIQPLAEQQRRWNERFFKLPPAQRSAVWAKEGRQRLRASTAYGLRSPVNRTLALLVGRLSPPQWAALRQGRPLLFSTDPQRGEQRLPAEISQAFRSAHPSMDDTWRYGDAEVAERERQKQRSMEAEWAAAPGYRVTVRLDADRFQRSGSLGLHAYATPLRPTAGPASAYAQAEGASLQLSAEPAEPGSQAEDDTPERRAALEKDPLLGARKRFQRQPKPRPDPGANPNFTGLQDLLPDLARSCDLNLIADSYNADRSGFPIPSAEPTSVYVLLDRITQYGYHWDRKGDLIRIRHRAWFFARPRSVPIRVVRRWNALLAGGSEPPLAEYAATAAALNDDQIELLPGLIRRGEPLFVHEIFRSRHALRLYASLTPLQQEALWRGQPLPFAAMTPAQRALFVAPWQERQQARDRDEPSPEPSGPSIQPLGPASRFALSAERMILTTEKKGEMTHFRWEPAPDPAPSSPASDTRTTPAASRAPGSSSAAGAARGPRTAGPPTSNTTRRTLARVRFRFLYAPDLEDGTEVSVAPDSAHASSGANGLGPAASGGTGP